MNPKYKYRCLAYFDIVLRFFEKLKTTHDGVPFKSEHMIIDANKVLDDIYVFFIFCHHMKDWIKNDDLVDPKVKCGVEDFVKKYSCLRFCADIANGTKHFKLNRYQRSKLRPKFVRVKRSIISGKVLDGTKIDSPEYSDVIVKDFNFLITDNGEMEVFDLASKCINIWKEFIEKNIYKEEAK
jgi:hypothetical protein